MKKCIVKSGLLLTSALAALFLIGCSGSCLKCESGVSLAEDELLQPSSTITLPNKYNSPDGMTIGKDGNIYIAMNNVGDQSYPAKICTISPSDEIALFSDLPVHPKTGKVSPLGIVFGSDGNLYVADNQTFVTEERNLSRLLRVNVENGKAMGVEVVATGLNMANGLSAFGDYIVVNDTNIDPTYPLTSGTYRFTIQQLDNGPVNVSGVGDPNLIVQLKTQNKDHQVGANGVAYDKAGNMFVCNFGDAEIWKTTFKANGDVDSFEVLCKGQGMVCVDGLQIDDAGLLWTADFLGNAIASICPDCAEVTIVAKNEPGDGSNGMDAPSECIRRGNKVYVSNIDLTYGPNTGDEIHTMTVYELP